MSTTASPSTAAEDHELPKEERLKSFLEQKIESENELYFKSKFIADEVGLSSKEIGALMVKLRESAETLNIEKWSYTSATTWRITPA